jgi:hypothetical protein
LTDSLWNLSFLFALFFRKCMLGLKQHDNTKKKSPWYLKLAMRQGRPSKVLRYRMT